MTEDYKLTEYITAHSSKEKEYLHELNRATHLKVLRPRMISGHQQGMLLYMITRMLNPKKVLELGTFTGYSAINIARGMQSGSQLITIDKNDELRPIAEEHIAKAGLEDIIKCVNADATEFLQKNTDTYDLIFLDADKSEYSTYYNLVIEKVTNGGFILADNVLWYGKVFDDSNKDDPQTQGILAFNKLIAEDDRVEKIILPLRDGLSIIRKK